MDLVWERGQAFIAREEFGVEKGIEVNIFAISEKGELLEGAVLHRDEEVIALEIADYYITVEEKERVFLYKRRGKRLEIIGWAHRGTLSLAEPVSLRVFGRFQDIADYYEIFGGDASDQGEG